MASEVALITGCGSGVGAATARRLIASGTQVVGIDRQWGPETSSSGNIARINGNVTEPEIWKQALTAVHDLGGQLTQIVFNAAQLIVGTVLEVSDAEFRRVFDVNVFAVVLGLRQCLPKILENGGGSIVAVASVDAFLAEQRLAAYCASKGALLQLMRAVAIDYARQGIRANCVCPGAIDTPFFRRHIDAAPNPERFLEDKTQRHPAGRILNPEDVAEVVEFLLNARSIGITGTAVTVDGGLTSTFDFQYDRT